ncbi:tripartite tricarboxylate transporter substrate binding protein BugE [Variovorax sp. PvP013]|uniref:tripartite tricarboxylate transporter substrate binding protein BugE n=1 Tax=Variovorax sp. PvP013 TaxID=3156435 RepID=UPI003D1B3ED8
MLIFSFRRDARALLCTLAFTASAAVLAQPAYPSKPIRLIVPFAAGGTTDIIARVVSEPLGRELGQAVIVDNKSGAGGTIGATEAMRAKPDGYTLSVATVSTTATNPAITPRFPYNPETDFVPIINIAATPNIVAVNPKFPAKNYEEFVEELRKNPNKYSYASTGTGSITHMLMELYKSMAGVQMTHIPYRGAGPASNDVVANQVSMNLDNLPSSLPFIKDGRLVPIVVAAPQRLAVLPQVPTFKEVGLEPVNRMAYYGIVGPRGTSREVVDRINSALKKVLTDPAVMRRIENTGSLVIANTPEQFAEQIKNEFATYKDVVTKQKLTLD